MKKLIQIKIENTTNHKAVNLYTKSLVEVIRYVLMVENIAIGEVKYYENDGVDFDLSNLSDKDVLQIICHNGKIITYSIQAWG